MVCFKCGENYDNSLSACPKCGTAAAVPVIPETEHRTAFTLPKATISAPETRPVIAEKEETIQQQSEPEQAELKSSTAKKIIAVMTAIIVFLIIAVMLLISDRNRLKAELEENEGSSGSSHNSSAKNKNDEDQDGKLLDTANRDAKIVFEAALKVTEDYEIYGYPIGSGIICSNPMIGDTAGSFNNAEYVMYEIRNVAERTRADIEWFVVFDDGVPVAAYASEGVESEYIGSYPTPATNRCTMSFENGKANVDRELGGTSISANTLYGSKSAAKN